MKAGNSRFHWSILALIVVIVSVSGSLVFADTPDATCANDSLFLISPDELVFDRQVNGRNGLVISWEDLDPEEATCFVLTGHENLDYSVEVDGGFGDQVDRQMLFTVIDTSTVGSTDPVTLQMTWVTEGSSNNGTLSGTINLGNNGGIYKYDAMNTSWEQTNEGLPVTWAQTNSSGMDAGSNGFVVAAFSSGQTIGSFPKGLYKKGQLGWQRIAEDVFTETTNVTKIAVSPDSNDHFAVGTDNKGLFVTLDGGQNFVNWAGNLDEDFQPTPVRFQVSALSWVGNRIWVFLPNLGLFSSDDNGVSFTRSLLEVDETPGDPSSDDSMPVSVNEIVVNPSNDDHILAAVHFNGIYQSTDGGLTWSNMYGDLPSSEGDWNYTGASAVVDPADANIVVAGMKGRGLYRTADGGTTWVKVGQNTEPDSPSGLIVYSFLISDGPGNPYYCLIDSWSVLYSTDQGATWNHLPDQPLLSSGINLALAGDGSGDFYMNSWGGGVYVPGTSISLSETYDSATSEYLRDLDLGINITFGAGDIIGNPQFRLKCQTFQGWAVWRGPGYDPENMTLIGVFDRVNPESCIEGYCGNLNWQVLPQCYNSKRAACFNFDTPDTVRFFDEEIYNGFTYNYAVTSFDYGNTALTSPENSVSTAIYSPRWTGDELSPYTGPGNHQYIQLDNVATDPQHGEEIYVYPNPLRLDSGLPGQEGQRVVFTNLPEGSRLRIFTTAGDDVINLGPDNLDGGNIYWRSDNRNGEPVSAGVYLYKVEMPSREDYWGKIVIIR